MEFFSLLGHLLLRQAVLHLVILGGIIFAVVRWKRHPRVSLMTTLGLVLYLLDLYVFWFLFQYLPRFFDTLHLAERGTRLLEVMLELADSFAFAAVLILLVAAAFTQRKLGSQSTIEGTN